MGTAKVFWSGRSQAVRLPKAFRLDTDEVRVRRRGNTIVLEPIPTDWTWLAEITGAVDEDFERAANDKPLEQQRSDLDIFQ